MNDLSTLRDMVDPQDPDLSIVAQCELLGIHRSGLYYTADTESEQNLEIMRRLDEHYLETPFYGVERLLVSLSTLGFKINRKRLRRLMGLVGW